MTTTTTNQEDPTMTDPTIRYYVVTSDRTYGPYDHRNAIKVQNHRNAIKGRDGEGSCDALVLTVGQVRMLGLI